MKLLIQIVALSFVAAALAQSDTIQQPERPDSRFFGYCYFNYNCFGTPMGMFDDNQCRQWNGHSIKQGDFCWNL